MVAEDTRRQVLEGLREALGSTSVLTSDNDTEPFVNDWRGRYHGRALAVVRPGTTAEVSRVVALCREHGIAVVPQGGNTGLCGGATPDAAGDAVVLALERLNRVRSLDPLDNTMVVEAGCVLAAIQAAAEGVDRLFPMSLGAEGSCQIGGNLATNAGGTAVLRYGAMRDLVLGLEVVLPDGQVWDGLRRLRKNNTGYDLKHLFVGAEGTLGIITAAVLKLFPAPRVTRSAMAALPDLDAALSILASMRTALGDRLNAYEIISQGQVDLVIRHMPGIRNPVATPAPWYLMVEATDTLDDLDLAGVLEGVLGEAIENGAALDAVIPATEAQAQGIWTLRHSVSEANRREGVSISHDTSVPVSRVPDFVRACTARLIAEIPGCRPVIVGHLGDGNVHVVVFLAPGESPSPEALETVAERINAIVHDESAARDGSISAEHGIGQSHAARLPLYKSKVEMDLMRTVKRALDPNGLFNPGKVLATS